jgi:hypothetical protein
VAFRCSLSSGILPNLLINRWDGGLGPDAIARYCLPLTSKVIGGALKPVPTLTFHNSSSVVASKAATVPSNRPRNTSPPPVASGAKAAGRFSQQVAVRHHPDSKRFHSVHLSRMELSSLRGNLFVDAEMLLDFGYPREKAVNFFCEPVTLS